MCTKIYLLLGEADKDPIWNPNSVPKRKRSKLNNAFLAPVKRLQRQHYNILQEPKFGNIPDGW